jgi:hypothetical protein
MKPDSGRLSGVVAVVTGGSRGLGEAAHYLHLNVCPRRSACRGWPGTATTGRRNGAYAAYPVPLQLNWGRSTAGSTPAIPA